MNKILLETINLKKIYEHVNGNIILFNNLNLKIKSGDLIALVGPSGSGKSSLLHLLALLDEPSKGKILINSKETKSLNNSQKDEIRRKNISIIFQDNNLLTDFTALENVYLANLSINDDKDSAITKAKVLLKKIGLSNRLNHFPSQLSGGECQRVAIARAIINDPEIILADEPTGSLDLNTAKEIFELLNNQKKPDRLIIFATHNRFFADKADCLLEIIDGSVKTINV